MNALLETRDDTFARVRDACCDVCSSEIDLDDHAAAITLVVHAAKATGKLSEKTLWHSIQNEEA